MANSYHHAVSSARKFGGTPADYQAVHDWLDSSKVILAEFRHRALRHHAEGCFAAEAVFGTTITNSDRRAIPVRLIAEQHILEDLGLIPSFADWVRCIRPEPWDGTRGHKARYRGAGTEGDLAMMLRTFFDASSGHLSTGTWAWLDAQLSDTVLRDPRNASAAQIAGGKTRYGWLVYAPESIAEDLLEDLTRILLRARAQGAEYVLFDRDAPPAPDWPILHPDFLD